MSTLNVESISHPTSGSNVTINGITPASTGSLGLRNLIINGAMQVAQRGTSVSVSDGSNEGYQTLDRFGFYFGASADGAATISQDTTVPSGEGFSNSYKVDVTTTNTPSGTESIFIRYIPEAQDLRNSGWNYTSTSSYITLSFWARSSKAGTYCLWLDLSDTTTNEYYVAEYTLAAGTWKRVEITVPGHADAVINNDNGSGLEIAWVLASNDTGATAGSWSDTSARSTTNQVNVFDSTDGEFYLTGVQLEVGEVATPFEHRSYADELYRCQRYYEQQEVYRYYKLGSSPSATKGYAVCQYLVPKRAIPGTITLPSGANSGDNTMAFLTPGTAFPSTIGSHVANSIGVNGFRIEGTSYSGLTSGSVTFLYSASDQGTSFIKIDAEL